MPFAATWMDLENTLCLVKYVKPKQLLYVITYKWIIKNNTKECIYKTVTDSWTENKLVVTKGERDKLRDGINRYKQLYIKEVSNKDLPYSTGNYTQYLVITYRGI